MLRSLIVLLALHAVLISTLPAQGRGVAGQEPQLGCFRGRPLPACKSFWIFEMQLGVPVAQTSRTVQPAGHLAVDVTAFPAVFEWNIGHMSNVGDDWALGGLLTVGTGSGGPLTGFKARVRRWVGTNVSAEAEAGALWSNANAHRDDSGSGGTAALRLNVRDQGSLYLRWDVLPLSEEIAGGDPGGTQHSLSIGVGTGSKTGLISTGAASIALVVLIAIYGVGTS